MFSIISGHIGDLATKRKSFFIESFPCFTTNKHSILMLGKSMFSMSNYSSKFIQNFELVPGENIILKYDRVSIDFDSPPLAILFYNNGIINIKTEYQSNELHGTEIENYANGQLKYKVQWVRGHKRGEEVRYFSNGRIKSVKNWN